MLLRATVEPRSCTLLEALPLDRIPPPCSLAVLLAIVEAITLSVGRAPVDPSL